MLTYKDLKTISKSMNIDKRYEFAEMIKDCDGDCMGSIWFKYNNDEIKHDFVYVANTRELVSIDYGYKIPYIDEVFLSIESNITEIFFNYYK